MGETQLLLKAKLSPLIGLYQMALCDLQLFMYVANLDSDILLQLLLYMYVIFSCY